MMPLTFQSWGADNGTCAVLGAEVESVNTRVVTCGKLDNQILEGSHLAGWKVKIRQLLSLKCSRNFFSFNIYTNACAYCL